METKFEPSEGEKRIAERLREAGQPNTADYIEMFGAEKLSPWFFNTVSVDQKEKFYKKCVEEGHSYEYYQGVVDGEIL